MQQTVSLKKFAEEMSLIALLVALFGGGVVRVQSEESCEQHNDVASENTGQFTEIRSVRDTKI